MVILTKNVRSYLKLYDILSMCGFEEKTVNLISTVATKIEIDASILILTDIEIVNKALQHSDSTKVTISFTRTCFNGLIDK